MTRSIRKIEPLLVKLPVKKRVAAYARVSSGKDTMLHSLSSQISYYSEFIQKHHGWEYAGVYADEAITGTKENRTEFQRLLADCRNGKIDMIITKSISRFARNTVTMLESVRELKSLNVDVFFEKENIYTLDSKGELLITIMSSLAQEESRSISENVTWGQRKRFADGKVSIPYGQFLGYEKGEDGLPKIVEKEATVVRMIYKLFLEGKTTPGIARHLTESGIPTPAGKNKWQPSTVLSILRNEKYKGDAILQKTFTVDFLTKKKKINEGEVPQYYVENSHPAIIAPEVFDLVQHELKKRKDVKGYKTGGGCFSGKIVCGECGGFYGSKVWHSTSKYRRTIWQCNHKFKNDRRCNTPHLYEGAIKDAFVEVFNSIINNKDEILQGYEEIIHALTDTTEFDKESVRLQNECEVVAELLRKCVEENAHSALDQQEYQQRYTALVKRYETAKSGLAKISDKRLERIAKRESMGAFIGKIKQSDRLLSDFDEELWIATIDKVTVHSEKQITFTFKDGLKLDWNI